MGNKPSSKKESGSSQGPQRSHLDIVPSYVPTRPLIPTPQNHLDKMQLLSNVRTRPTTESKLSSLITSSFRPAYQTKQYAPFDRDNFRDVQCPSSYQLWTEAYQSSRLKPGELDNFKSRIVEKSELKKNESAIHNIKLERCAKISDHYTNLPHNHPLTAKSFNSIFDVSDRLAQLRALSEKYFPTEPKKPELTPEILEVVEQASKSYPPDELLSEIDGAEIRRKDITTLKGLNWLNDEVVNAYMNLLAARGDTNGRPRVHSFNTFFYPKLRESGYSSIRRWTRKVDIFSYDFILVPVHLGNHWCLAIVDFKKRTISYYDSLRGQSNGCCDTLLDYLRYESKDKKKQEFDDENWHLVNRDSDDVPRQNNGSDCGVFACTYAEYLTRRAKLSFSQEDMPYFRKKMIYELVKKKILE